MNFQKSYKSTKQISKRMEHKKFIAATKVSLVEFAIHLNFKLTNLVFD